MLATFSKSFMFDRAYLFDLGYFCVRAAWTAMPDDFDMNAANYSSGSCLCPTNVTGGMCQPGYYCPMGSEDPVSCE